ncbi:MAG: nucleoside triphosphate pyrophosphohydrolase [Syntrophorhabdus sp.]|nr:nucleoside triphosphate pyrophosphohydrolase [Syntrophorhabdus sp.]
MEEFSKLVELMATLRSDKGCLWDKKQTIDSFKTFVLEEVYELIDSIEKANYSNIKEELGDLLFHIVFISQICKEGGFFDIIDVVKDVYNKMYNRHPHVFGDMPRDIPIEVKWEELKKNEKGDYSPLQNIPHILPALLRAYIISKRAAKVGFDWPGLEDVHEKMHEEIVELQKAEQSGNIESIKEEIGDLLFTIVNISRFHNIDPEDALRSTSNKFVNRFSYIEKNTDLSSATLEIMDRLWNEVKGMEKKGH